jgi:hypothetical protein
MKRPRRALRSSPVPAALPFTTSHAEWIGLIVASISLIGIGGIVSTLICHRKGCFRRGRFRCGHYRLCHVHHPDVPSDGNITDEHIATCHAEVQAAKAAHAPAKAPRPAS